jgi:hypothetical protein
LISAPVQISVMVGLRHMVFLLVLFDDGLSRIMRGFAIPWGYRASRPANIGARWHSN